MKCGDCPDVGGSRLNCCLDDDLLDVDAAAIMPEFFEYRALQDYAAAGAALKRSIDTPRNRFERRRAAKLGRRR